MKRRIWIWAIVLCIATDTLVAFQATGRYSAGAVEEGRVVILIGVAFTVAILVIAARSRAR